MHKRLIVKRLDSEIVVYFSRLRFGSVKIRLEEIVKVILMSPHRTKHNIRLTFIGLPDVSITNLKTKL